MAAQDRVLFTVVESTDERGLAELIADRTLSVSHPEPPRSARRGLLLLGTVALLLVVVVSLWMWQSSKGQGGQTGAEETAQGQGDAGPTLPSESGVLNCNAWPPATVVLDGKKRLGQTPIRNLPLPAGSHTLSFTSADGLLHKEVQIQIEPQQVKTVAVTLSESEGGMPLPRAN